MFCEAIKKERILWIREGLGCMTTVHLNIVTFEDTKVFKLNKNGSVSQYQSKYLVSRIKIQESEKLPSLKKLVFFSPCTSLILQTHLHIQVWTELFLWKTKLEFLAGTLSFLPRKHAGGKGGRTSNVILHLLLEPINQLQY